MLRCSSFQKLINRSLRSPWSSFPPPLSRTRSVDLFFFFFLLLLRRRFSRASSIMLLLLLLLYSSRGLCPVARALVRLFVLSACTAVLLLPWRRQSRQTGFRRALFISLLYRPPPPWIPRIHRRLGVYRSRTAAVVARERARARALSDQFTHCFSLRSEKKR